MIDLNDRDARAAAAAEYVLGTLDAEDRAAVDVALEHDTALRAEVYAWQDRLLALSTRAAPVDPAASSWSRIEAAIDAAAARQPAPGVAAGVGARETRGTLPPGASAPARQGWWQRLGLWQGISAAAVAASLLLSVMLLTRPLEPTGARYVAVLQSPTNQATGWVVEVQVGGKLRLVPVGTPDPVPAGRALQFWTKPEGAAGPTSLGLVQAGRAIELPVSRLPAVDARQLFEITLEPEGGSTIGRPTGPILYLGRTVAHGI